MARYKKEESSGFKSDPNAWMVTFSDLTMLLLTFFVMLLTMKSMETGKARQLFLHAEGPLDFVEPTGAISEKQENENLIKLVSIASTETLDKAITLLDGMETPENKDAAQINLRDVIAEMSENNRGITIHLKADELFDTGKAEVREDRLNVLNAIAKLLRYATNDILILGHTDNIPIKTERYSSNLELSVYRSLNVLNYLAEKQGLKPERLAAGGYGDFLPRYANDTPEGRSKNRRIEITIRKS